MMENLRGRGKVTILTDDGRDDKTVCMCGGDGRKVDAASEENPLKLPRDTAFFYRCSKCGTSWLPPEEDMKIEAALKKEKK
jgi:hypothetical protein